MTDTILHLKNVTKKFRNITAVDDISLKVKRGEIIGFIGPNGAGKTTTLKLIAQLIEPTSGIISILNKNGRLKSLSKNPKNLIERGFLIDVPHFYNTTPNRILKYICHLRRYPNNKIKKRINQLLSYFKLEKWKYTKISKFSKGMIQKLGFISSIINEPDLIILDEPQTGLDPNARIDIREFIKKLKKQNKTIFIASHMLYEISEICDKIAIINNGSLLKFDTLQNLIFLVHSKKLECEILEELKSTEINKIEKLLKNLLSPYISLSNESSKFKNPIEIIPNKKKIIIFYDGKEETKAKILDILFNEFKNFFTIKSFSEPKTSNLEKLYNEMILDE